MNTSSRTDLSDLVIEAYLAVSDTIRLASLPDWLTADMSLSQLKTLILLEYLGQLTVSELARRLGIGNPAASILVQQMVEQALVERLEDTKDRRRTFVRPTASGTALIAGRREQIRTYLLRWLSQLADDELASLKSGLEALARVIRSEADQKSQAKNAPLDKNTG